NVEGSQPCHRFSPKIVSVRVVFNLKWDIASSIRKHDSSPTTKQEKWQRVCSATPDFFHNAAPDMRNSVVGRKPKSPLDLRMQLVKFTAQHVLVYGRHDASDGATRRQLLPLGTSLVTKAVILNAPIATLSDTGLKGRLNIDLSA